MGRVYFGLLSLGVALPVRLLKMRMGLVLPLDVAKRGSNRYNKVHHHMAPSILFTCSVLKDYILNSSVVFGVSMKCIQNKVRLKIDLY